MSRAKWIRAGWLLALPMAVLLILAVACGDDATPTTQPTATTGPAATTAPPTPTTPPGATTAPTVTTAPGLPTPTTAPGLPTPTAEPTPSPFPTATVAVTGRQALSEGTIGFGLVGPRIEDYGTPNYGGITKVLSVGSMRSWELQSRQSLSSSNGVHSPLVNGLLHFDQWTFDRFDIIGDLATDWRQVDAFGKVWEFNINPDAVWHDGSPVTAQDIVYSFDRMTGRTARAEANSEAGKFVGPHYDFGEAVDEKTFRLHLVDTWADFLAYMANDLIQMVPEAVYTDLDQRFIDGEDVYDELDGWVNIVGSGPFVVSNVREKNIWELEKNPIYWKKDPDGRALPYLDGAEYFSARAFTRESAEAAWDAEVVWQNNIADNGTMSPGAMRDLIVRSGNHVAYPVPCCPHGLGFNIAKPPFDNADVRKAVSLVIDRPAMVDLTWGGVGLIGTICGPPGHIMCRTPEEVALLPGFGADKAQDIATARQLMQNAGFGEGFSTTLLFNNFQPLNEIDAVPVMQDNLRTINIDATGTQVDFVAQLTALANGQFDLVTLIGGAGVITPTNYLARYMVELNHQDWRHPSGRVMDLIAEQDRELDIARRQALVREIDDLLLEDSFFTIYHIDTYARFFNVDRVAGQMPVQSGYAEGKLEHIFLVNP